MIPFKAVASPVDERRGAREELPLLSVSQYHGVRNRSEITDEPPRAEDLSNYKVCRAGQLVVNRMSAYQGALGMAPVDGVVSPDYLVLQMSSGRSPEFWSYYMRGRDFVAEMSSRVRGIGGLEGGNVRTPRINYSDLKTIAVPNFDGQYELSVVDFLDRETAKIDAVIEKQRALAEGLRGRRQAVISGAFDGVQAELSPLKRFLVGIKDGTHGSFERVDPDDGSLLLSAKNIQDGRLEVGLNESYVSESDRAAIVASGFPRRGDVLLTVVGSVGKTAVYEFDESHAFQRSVAFLRPLPNLHPYFLWYQIQSERFREELQNRTNVSAQPGVYLGSVSQVPIKVPSAEEQARVVDFLARETSRIDALITRSEHLIELSQERRSALITAAVTGQIDMASSTDTMVLEGAA